MKQIVVTALLLAMGSSLAFAQYKAVNFDYEKNYFNQGQALPAEDYFMVSGAVNSGIDWSRSKYIGAEKWLRTNLFM
ncbi:MAG: hypothetical protein IPL33_11770 [Sphingobacteriales bacterium]|nr:hypothetical protein [Sphingobacteriales bacterium]